MSAQSGSSARRGVAYLVGLALLSSACDPSREPLGPEDASLALSEEPSFTKTGRPSVTLCHRAREEGAFVKITVADRAVPSHLLHGDAFVGDPAPGRPGMTLDETCDLVEGFSISGHAYYSATPLTGVTVELYLASGGSPLQTTLTESGGSYEFGGVTPDTYRVRFYGPDPTYVTWTAPPPVQVVANATLDHWLPKAIQLLAPPDGSVVPTPNPTLEWSPIAEAVTYTVQINETATWNLLEIGGGATASHVVQAGLTPGVEYTWQVDARDASAKWVGGTMDSFTMTY